MIKRTVLIALVALTLIIPSGILQRDAGAVSGSDWDAGNIIDDTIFTDTSRLTVSQIQDFLNSQMPSCDTNGTSTSELGGGTRAQYGATHGNPAPFTCLKDYYEVPKLTPGPDVPASNYGGVAIPSGAKSAAQMISDASQKYNISPAVLLVKLGTESAGPLNSDPWPFKKQYNYAMGAHCPDSGPGGSANCDPNYSGFSIQISEAASLIRGYLDNMDQSWWTYKKPYQVNTILWNVSQTNCGSSGVYIQNKATAALYTYTPYQPNQAALANLYGTGDGCSAYGNRNFWRVYSDWFGSTKGTIIRTYEDGKMYVRGAGDTYYYITNGDQLTGLGYGSTIKTYYNTSKNVFNDMTFMGNLPNTVRFNSGSSIYLINGGQKHYYDNATWVAYGSPAEGNLSSELESLIPTGTALTTVVRSQTGFDLYSIEGGRKRYIGGPSIYQSGGYSTKTISPLTNYLFNSLTEGAPILAAGTIVKTTDTNVTSVITQSGAAVRTIEANTAKSVAQSPFLNSSTVINQLTSDAAVPITLLVKNGVGDLFITDTTKKIHLTNAQMLAMNKTPSDFTLVEDVYLSRFSTVTTSGDLLLSIDGGPMVYKVTNGEIVHIQTGNDFVALGYNSANILSLSNNTVANLLTNKYRSILLPGLLFRVDGQPTVYVFGYDNKPHAIPTGFMFDAFKFNWASVRVVTANTPTAYTSGSNTSYVIVTPDDAWWLVSNGLRFWIPNSLHTAYTSSLNAPTSVSITTLATINPTRNATQFMRIDNTPTIYYITGGQKHALSPTVFNSLGGTLDQVISVSPYTAENFSTGSVMY
ncbi:MAG: hypothetical protein ABIP50_00855 [Candidatus Saccharimonadales bacterium]